MSTALPESIERAEEVLAYANVVLSRADSNGGDELSTEVQGDYILTGEPTARKFTPHRVHDMVGTHGGGGKSQFTGTHVPAMGWVNDEPTAL